MALTYRELIENLKALPDEKLDTEVVVYVTGLGDYYTLVHDYPYMVSDTDNNDQLLKPEQPYLVI